MPSPAHAKPGQPGHKSEARAAAAHSAAVFVSPNMRLNQVDDSARKTLRKTSPLRDRLESTASESRTCAANAPSSCSIGEKLTIIWLIFNPSGEILGLDARILVST